MDLRRTFSQQGGRDMIRDVHPLLVWVPLIFHSGRTGQAATLWSTTALEGIPVHLVFARLDLLLKMYHIWPM